MRNVVVRVSDCGVLGSSRWSAARQGVVLPSSAECK